jgi:tRNA-specific 2-thiouridylase
MTKDTTEEGLVAVAMSGGVDSSVAALLLQRQGLSAVGLTMRLWAHEGGEASDRTCCTVDAAIDARRVCNRLGLPHYALDFSEVFLREVVDPFVADYLAGRTPNPCVRCNTFLKWDALWERAVAVGATRLATGHYARIRQIDGEWRLLRGEDPAKDQSYFLWGIPRALLARTLFPLGDLEKTDTRRLAEDAGLPTAKKGESQDICFVPGGDYRAVVRARAGEDAALLRPGPIVGPGGKVLGNHEGLAGYTIGQRRGIKVAWSEPLYVVAIEPATNTLRLGTGDGLSVHRLVLEQENWLEESPWDLDELSVQVRYRGSPVDCRLVRDPEGTRVELAEPVSRPAAGQSMVVYQGDRVVGGGVLSRAD